MTSEERELQVRFYCFGVRIEFDPEDLSISELDSLIKSIATCLEQVKTAREK